MNTSTTSTNNGNGNHKNTDPLRETAARGVEAIHAIVVERDTIRARNERLEVDIVLMAQEIDHLKRQLTVSASERDHYMRHSVELTSRLNDIQIVINEAIRAARDGAFRPNSLPAPRSKLAEPSAEDMTKLEGLIARLPQNGGNGDGA